MESSGHTDGNAPLYHFLVDNPDDVCWKVEVLVADKYLLVYAQDEVKRHLDNIIKLTFDAFQLGYFLLIIGGSSDDWSIVFGRELVLRWVQDLVF